MRVGRELKEEKENGEKETRTRKQLETALKVEQTNALNIWWPMRQCHAVLCFYFTDWYNGTSTFTVIFVSALYGNGVK